MKLYTVYLILFAPFLFLQPQKAVGEIIENDMVLLNTWLNGNWTLQLTNSTHIKAGELHFNIHSNDYGTFEFTPIATNGYCALYTISNGTFFTHAVAETTTPFVANTSGGPNSATILMTTNSESVYFGYWVDQNADGIHDSYDNYGWAALHCNDGFLLILLGHRTAVAGGVIAGTSQLIPRPGELNVAETGMIQPLGTIDGSYTIQYSDSPSSPTWRTMTNITIKSTPTSYPIPITNTPWRVFRSAGTIH